MKQTTETLIALGFDESDIEMCEGCGDAAQAHRARGMRVCMDCFVEMGV